MLNLAVYKHSVRTAQ